MFIVDHQNAIVSAGLITFLICRPRSAFIWIVLSYYLMCSMIDVYMNGYHRVGVVFSDSVLEHYALFSMVDFSVVAACAMMHAMTAKRAFLIYGCLVVVYFAADVGQFVMEFLYLGHKTIEWHSNLQSIQILLDSLVIYLWARDENLVNRNPSPPFSS